MEANNIKIAETVSASQKLQASDAKLLLGSASRLVAMKGKKVSEFNLLDKVNKDSVNAMLGPTGNLRAPTIRVGSTYLVGYNEEIFSAEFA
ncbi:uncharacterized protein METZ01_LOCUS427532 [marine metagenome]|uniref:Glutaredoxin domain-containing protein n=1 Tax=marine metagenome TaxID=408172 RepID=A0A382XWL1_9ZZZZ